MSSSNFQASGDGESKNFVLLQTWRVWLSTRQMFLALLTTGLSGKMELSYRMLPCARLYEKTARSGC